MEKSKMMLLSIVSFVLAVIFFLLKMAIGTQIDADGVLYEPFFLIPLGYLFLFVGIISLITHFIQRNK